MNRRWRIGVFDSGIGGLDLFARLRDLLPAEHFYYFADTVNNPYGEKSREQIETYLCDIIDGMLMRQVKLIVIACNTASAVYLSLAPDHPLRRRLRDAGVDVIPIATSEAVSDLALLSPSRVLVVGTRVTVESGVYRDLLRRIVPDSEIEELAAPQWVERIEHPDKNMESELAYRRDAVRDILASHVSDPPDALLLACTHFPALTAAIREVLGDKTVIVNPAQALAHFIDNYLSVRNLHAEITAGESAEESVVFTNGPAATIEERLLQTNTAGRFHLRQVDIRDDFSGKTVDIVGFGVTGQSVLRHLQSRQPARVRVRDKGEKAHQQIADMAATVNVEVITGEHYLAGIEEADIVFRSPGVPADLPAFGRARDYGVPVRGDIDLFLQQAQGRKIAITGTNGKTTTTILAHRLFDRDPKSNAHIVGNVGRPVLDDLPLLGYQAMSVMELSSFQLEELDVLPVEGAVLLNITPDHLDRHGNLDDYAKAKGRIFTLLGSKAFAIFNMDSEAIVSKVLPMGCRAHMVPFSRTRPLEQGAFLDGNDLVFVYQDKQPLRIKDYLTRKGFIGSHNFENLMASGLAAYLLGVSENVIAETLLEFRGVAYRIEHCHRHEGVDFYDDSKGTNPDATIQALQTLTLPIHLIAGGMNKGYGFDDVAAACKGRVRKAYLFGEIADAFSHALSRLSEPIESTLHADLDSATQAAASEANAGEIVLFSPACASPTGEKYYQRGNRFKAVLAATSHNELSSNTGYLPDPLAEK